MKIGRGHTIRTISKEFTGILFYHTKNVIPCWGNDMLSHQDSAGGRDAWKKIWNSLFENVMHDDAKEYKCSLNKV